MATQKRQRIGIWVIAIVMTIGTIGSFAVMILANQNSTADQARLTKLTDEYQKMTQEHQVKVAAQGAELSNKYYSEFNQYSTRPAPFNKDEVKELKTEDLKAGDGETLGGEATFTAYYIGWNPDGKVFDGSISGSSLKAPFEAAPGGVISGWTKGVEGMKVGGVREVTIPSDLAYGESGSGDLIPPNTPLKFVIMVIPKPEAIPQPEMPKELLNYYTTGKF